MKKVELLSPAGGLLKMKFAFAYGADAVYGGIKNFSLREGAENFSLEELKEATDFSHSLNKKFYLATNIFLHEDELNKFKEVIKEIAHTGVDALLVSDPGALIYLRENFPEIPIHISTQANTLNSEAVRFYEKLGVKRIILARELTLDEIKRIRDKTSLELETFVHGAICIAYAGRCLLSNYFTNPSLYRPFEKPEAIKNEKTRDANRGDCAQACRWSYYIVETTRKEDFLPLEIEDNYSTTIMSSKDLNLAPLLKELIDAGIDSFKIEGRMKSIYYVANVTRVYRDCIDRIYSNLPPDNQMVEELNNVSHREYFTGFYFEENRLASHTTFKSYIRNYTFLGYIIKKIDENKYLSHSANQIKEEFEIEAINPTANQKLCNYRLLDVETLQRKEVIQPDSDFILECETKLEDFTILRKKENK